MQQRLRVCAFASSGKDASPAGRAAVARRWARGAFDVLVVGYEAVRALAKWIDREKACGTAHSECTAAHTRRKEAAERLEADVFGGASEGGPCVVVADEAHVLKNSKGAVCASMSRFRTTRRLALTGTPFSNHLNEYYAMVDWARPAILGTKAEFANQFANPIAQGRGKDATRADARQGLRRAHALHRKGRGDDTLRNSRTATRGLSLSRAMVSRTEL